MFWILEIINAGVGHALKAAVRLNLATNCWSQCQAAQYIIMMDDKTSKMHIDVTPSPSCVGIPWNGTLPLCPYARFRQLTQAQSCSHNSGIVLDSKQTNECIKIVLLSSSGIYPAGFYEQQSCTDCLNSLFMLWNKSSYMQKSSCSRLLAF